MASIARVPITNVYMGGDYTGVIRVGPGEKPMNVILDTGSSALALDGKKYAPAAGDQTTDLAQTDSYGDGSSWTGAVIKSTVKVGDGASGIALPNANVAVAYECSADMFHQADGILGLAYAPLDDAFTMPDDTLDEEVHVEPSAQRQGRAARAVPSPSWRTRASRRARSRFLTHRSFIHVGAGDPASDPLNQGVMIVGGGEEATDLYTGAFQTVKVLSDDWYSTHLKAIIVGSADPIAARLKGPQGMPSNSIIDSGTNSLNLSPQTLRAMISKFSALAAGAAAGEVDPRRPAGGSQRARSGRLADHHLRDAG